MAAAPRIVGAVATGAGANGVDLTDTLAVVAVGDAGVQIVNVANPANPFVVGAVDTPGDALDVVVKGWHRLRRGLHRQPSRRRLPKPTAPVLGGTTPPALGGILLDVARMDTFVFGADIFFVNGVPIIDVSDATNLAAPRHPELPRRRHGAGHCR